MTGDIRVEPGATDPRRSVPRTDQVLADPRLAAAASRLGSATVKSAVHAAQQLVREQRIAPGEVADVVAASLPDTAGGLRAVVNATGVLLHTNLGRAPLSPAAVAALVAAAGATDVELDLASGRRAPRGRAALDALRTAVPAAEDVHVVNNGAAALLLAGMALAAGREVVVSRGELVEIGDGFRIPDLLTSAGVHLREVGTTNRTSLADYERAISDRTAFILKVHPSNFVVSGFTSTVPLPALSGLRRPDGEALPLVYDIGSGLLARHPRLPDEPDADSALRAGADLVTASGDKLLGGPQCGLLLGRSALVQQLRRHPVARALRVDKLTLAALAATLTGPPTPTAVALESNPAGLMARAESLAGRLRAAGHDASAVASNAETGGGGAPGVRLDSAAVRLPEAYAERLRTGRPAVVGRVRDGWCLLDLFAVRPEDDEAVYRAVTALGVWP